MKKLALTTLIAFVMSIATAPLALAQTQTPSKTGSALTMPITGSGGGGSFAGTFELKKFVTKDGQVMASGILSGTVTTATGLVESILKNVLLPVTIGQTTCEILHLDLGPLSIDLLGLQIDLSRVVLDITAEAGAGNLLGNLLCAVVNLLNNPAELVRTLNQILDLLR